MEKRVWSSIRSNKGWMKVDRLRSSASKNRQPVGEEDRRRGSRSGAIEAIDLEEPIAELAEALVEECEASMGARIVAANIWMKALYGPTFSEKEENKT
ncbi:unnamed protein product [Victoria cruziana]